MIKFKSIALFAAATMLLASSCDEVKENERLIDMGEITAKRTVLLEEFTGQRCTNCPSAHQVVAKLLEQYGDGLIAVSINGGTLAVSESDPVPARFAPGLMTEQSNEIVSHWNVESFPNGMVNRSGRITSQEEWSSLIRTELEADSKVDIEVKASFDTETGKITVTADMAPGDNIDGMLQLWITESDIVAPQLGAGSTFIADYVHNHVFRAAVNGTWGEAVTLVTREPVSVTREISCQSNWSVDHLSVVAFIYTDAAGVLQAAECKVTPANP